MTTSSGSPAPGRPSRTLVERLEAGVLFLVSTLTLRALAALTLVGALVALAGLAWYAVPSPEPKEPPELAVPGLPGKPGLTPEELARGDDAAPAQPEERQAPAGAPRAAPAAEAARTALDVELDGYRPLAARLGMPFESEKKVVCTYRLYWGECGEYQERVVRKGLLELLRVDVFMDGAPDDVQIGLLRQARKLFETIERTPAGPGSLDGLAGQEGFKTFAASYLQPALDVVQGYRRVQRATDGRLPADQRLRLVEDVYPVVTGAVAALPDAGPVERRAAVPKALALLVKKEARRNREATSLLVEHARAEEARQARIRADRSAWLEAKERASARRSQAMVAVLGGVGGLALIGILLALLAIERHLRWLRDARAGAEGPAAAPARSPPALPGPP